MTRSMTFPASAGPAPFDHARTKGRAVALIVLAVGAVGITAWAGRAATAPAAPPPPCAAAGSVSSVQLEAATLRIRYADQAVTDAARGGSLYAPGKTGLSLSGIDHAAMLKARAELRAARDDLTLLCAKAALA